MPIYRPKICSWPGSAECASMDMQLAVFGWLFLLLLGRVGGWVCGGGPPRKKDSRMKNEWWRAGRVPSNATLMSPSPLQRRRLVSSNVVLVWAGCAEHEFGLGGFQPDQFGLGQMCSGPTSAKTMQLSCRPNLACEPKLTKIATKSLTKRKTPSKK